MMQGTRLDKRAFILRYLIIILRGLTELRIFIWNKSFTKEMLIL